MSNIFRATKEAIESIPGNVWGEIGVRIGLFVIFMILETADISPYARVIRQEEAWLYKYPASTPGIVSSKTLAALMILACVAVILIAYGVHREAKPGLLALLVPSLAIPLTGVVTNVLKITVGRPRPDFFARCHGADYNSYLDAKRCTGDAKRIRDGRKSFPSGHSSLSFCALGFVSFYLAAQLGTFSRARGSSGQSWRLMLALLPLFAATLVAVSRTCDYHHHWQDVTVGSFLGFSIMVIVYRQYFPSLADEKCAVPYPLTSDPNSGTSKGNYQQLEQVSSQ